MHDESFTKQPFSQTPTAHNVDLEPGEFPLQTSHNHEHTDMGDDGMVGAHRNDRVILRNSHPHQQHSKGHDAHHDSHLNHGIQGFYIAHSRRDKGPEHHPPKGLMEHNAVNNRHDMQSVLGDQLALSGQQKVS